MKIGFSGMDILKEDILNFVNILKGSIFYRRDGPDIWILLCVVGGLNFFNEGIL